MISMARAATKQMILCADDYGLAPEIDHAILNLGAAAQISAVSCMTGGPSWQQSAPLLRQTQGSLDLGLHFTLTEITPLGPMPHLAPTGQFPELATIIRCVILGQCDIGEIRAEAYRQMETFCQAIGRPPDHIDGHQHIHCFPRLYLYIWNLRIKI